MAPLRFGYYKLIHPSFSLSSSLIKNLTIFIVIIPILLYPYVCIHIKLIKISLSFFFQKKLRHNTGKYISNYLPSHIHQRYGYPFYLLFFSSKRFSFRYGLLIPWNFPRLFFFFTTIRLCSKLFACILNIAIKHSHHKSHQPFKKFIIC